MDEKRFDLLYSAVSDNQEIIRHLDVKIEVGLTILLAAFAAFLSQVLPVVTISNACIVNQIAVSLLTLIWLVCAFIAFSILRAQSNPIAHITCNADFLTKTPAYYLFELAPISLGSIFGVNDKSMLKPTQQDLLTRIKSLSHEDIYEVLTAELLKVSYIREIKLKKSRHFFSTLRIAVFSSLIYYSLLQFKLRCPC